MGVYGILFPPYYSPIMENKMKKTMENEMENPGPFRGVYAITENHLEKIMENWKLGL